MLTCEAKRHGTRGAYTAGCRCASAQKANREYARFRERRNAKIAHGAVPPLFIPVADARSVLEQLRGLGWSSRRIQAESGLRRDRLSRIAGGTNRPVTQVRRETYEALTALLERATVPIADGALVDAYQTWQRIHGLIAMGYTKNWIAQQTGHARAVQLAPYVITARNARKIEALAEKHAAIPGPSDRARAYAASRGWTADLLWPELDNTEPVVDEVDEVAVMRAMNGEPVDLTKAERLEVVRRLICAGGSKNDAARRLNVDSRQIYRELEKTG